MFEIVKLKYALDALEPSIDAATMEVHYTKHYKGYTNKLNNALEETTFVDVSIEDLLRSVGEMPQSISGALRNNGGWYYNHTIFWETIAPGGVMMSAAMQSQIEEWFGSVESMKEQFAKAAATRFGSGWAWLMQKEDGSLAITSTPNQDNPIMDVAEESGYPLLGLDVWEHAYYLKYQNRRPEYISARRDIVDWSAVEARMK